MGNTTAAAPSGGPGSSLERGRPGRVAQTSVYVLVVFAVLRADREAAAMGEQA